MKATFPFLTAYDPLGTSEGTLDPLGLYFERVSGHRVTVVQADAAVVEQRINDGTAESNSLHAYRERVMPHPDVRRHATLPQSWIQRENREFETHT